jgi:hypothetical protein
LQIQIHMLGHHYVTLQNGSHTVVDAQVKEIQHVYHDIINIENHLTYLDSKRQRRVRENIFISLNSIKKNMTNITEIQSTNIENIKLTNFILEKSINNNKGIVDEQNDQICTLKGNILVLQETIQKQKNKINDNKQLNDQQNDQICTLKGNILVLLRRIEKQKIDMEEAIKSSSSDEQNDQICTLKGNILVLQETIQKQKINTKYVDNTKKTLIHQLQKCKYNGKVVFDKLEDMKTKNLHLETMILYYKEEMLKYKKSISKAEENQEIYRLVASENIQKFNETEQKEETVQNECVVCFESIRTTAFVPCGHRCVCRCCATKTMSGDKLCPLCRKKSNSTLDVFI